MVREGIHRDKSVWKPGTIVERRGPVSYLVRMFGGQMQRKHVDHIRDVFAPPAVIISCNTGLSTVEFTSRVVPQEDSGNAVPDTNSSEEPNSMSGVETTPMCQSRMRFRIPQECWISPQWPEVHLCTLIPVVSEILLTDLLVLDI